MWIERVLFLVVNCGGDYSLSYQWKYGRNTQEHSWDESPRSYCQLLWIGSCHGSKQTLYSERFRVAQSWDFCNFSVMANVNSRWVSRLSFLLGLVFGMVFSSPSRIRAALSAC